MPLTSARHTAKVAHYDTGGGSVALDVVVGMGQAGGVAVTLAGRPVAHGVELRGLALGAGLRGQQLVVNATVLDANPNTDRTAVTVRLSGGPAPRELVSTADADPDQAVVHTFLVSLL